MSLNSLTQKEMTSAHSIKTICTYCTLRWSMLTQCFYYIKHLLVPVIGTVSATFELQLLDLQNLKMLMCLETNVTLCIYMEAGQYLPLDYLGAHH